MVCHIYNAAMNVFFLVVYVDDKEPFHLRTSPKRPVQAAKHGRRHC